MNPPIRQLKKWIAALDSGEYEQTKGCLEDRKGYCCLGVACKVLIPKNKQNLIMDTYLNGSMPDDQDHAPEWLKEISNDFRDKTGNLLDVLNDDKGYTFTEIATLLELVYVHKMLE